MEYMYLPIFFFLQLTFSYHIEQKKDDGRYPYVNERKVRSMQHPAFSMMMGSPMAFPGNTMQTGYMSGSQTECITEDIVCPAWCLMEDEWGCKYCPCGPANGMSPPVVSNHKPDEMKHEESHDCIGTILCMLSCKDGYKLGSRGKQDGCQTCTCVKKNETKSSAGTNNTNGRHDSNNTRTTDSDTCTWPMCMNGQGPSSGPGSGASMSSLPIGGVNGGGSLPGVDCIGPSCSAKNGMRMMGNVIPTKSSAPFQPPTTPAMPLRPTTKRPQRASTQKTLLLVAPTKPSRRLYIVPVPTEAPARHCATIEYCMNNCQYGFRVENSRQECPNCNCIIPMTPPPPTTTTRKPDFIAIMRVCPDAVHCMKSCTKGYTLTSSHTEACPICTCNREPKVLLLCERPLSCPNGCTVGYKGDEIGCPTCRCVAPSDSALTCNPKFSCVDKCSLGYKTGDNGCPTCICLQPVTDYYRHPSAVTQMPVPVRVQSSGLGCIGPACSAIHAVPPRLVLQCEQPLSCPYGCTVGYKCDSEGCPKCSCIAPSETTYKIDVQRVVLEKVMTCEAKFSCPERCSFGFKTGSDGCPSCICLQPVTVQVNMEHHQQPIVAPVVRATVSPLVHQLHMVPETVTQMSLPAVIAPSGIGCLSPSCTSVQQLGQSGNPFLSAVGHNQHGNTIPLSHLVSPHTGISSGNGNPAGTVTVQAVGIKKPNQSMGSGQKLVIEKPSNSLQVLQHTVKGSTVSPDASKGFSAMETCPETVRCMLECQGTYNLAQRDGDICPDCKCIHDYSGCIGPACSAPGSHRVSEVESTPSPGECVAILHCVMTCDSGYDIGEYSSDGCPTCTCVE